MKRLATLLLALVIGLAGTPAAAQPLTNVREAFRALLAGRYDEIEAFYAQVHRERKRDHRGDFLFEQFYWSLPWHSTDNPKDPDYWPKIDAMTSAWVAHSPRSYLAAMNRAFVLARRAEHLGAVGGSWSEIGRIAADSRRMVMAAKKLGGATDANWHATRLRVASVEGVPRAEVLDLVHAAVQADPYPMRIWTEAAIALSPGGQPAQDLPWLMRLAMQRTRAQEGATMYARVLDDLSWHYPELMARPFGAGVDWKTLHASFIEVEQRYPAAYSRDTHGALACLAGEREVTAKLIGDKTSAHQGDDWERWGGKPHFERCRTWATGTSPRPRV
jgi:hypothetical protein